MRVYFSWIHFAVSQSHSLPFSICCSSPLILNKFILLSLFVSQNVITCVEFWMFRILWMHSQIIQFNPFLQCKRITIIQNKNKIHSTCILATHMNVYSMSPENLMCVHLFCPLQFGVCLCHIVIIIEEQRIYQSVFHAFNINQPNWAPFLNDSNERVSEWVSV